MKLLKGVMCLFVGHKKLDVFDGIGAPFGVGAKDKMYPMWPCGRCDSMYVGPEEKAHDECCEEKHVEIVENK